MIGFKTNLYTSRFTTVSEETRLGLYGEFCKFANGLRSFFADRTAQTETNNAEILAETVEVIFL